MNIILYFKYNTQDIFMFLFHFKIFYYFLECYCLQNPYIFIIYFIFSLHHLNLLCLPFQSTRCACLKTKIQQLSNCGSSP